MLLAHLSDLHLSRFGETGIWSPREEKSNEKWESIHQWKGWEIEGLRDKKARPEKLRLVDPSGVIHKSRKWPKGDDVKAISALISLAMEKHLTSAENLVEEGPEGEDLKALLKLNESNANLRFLWLLNQIEPLDPDLIMITGDLTDHGFGYQLIEHYLRPWIESDRLLVVPGNHDTYDMYPRFGRKSRLSLRDQRYQDFAKKVGCSPEEHGAYVRYIDDIAFVGLNSCQPDRAPLSAAGVVGKRQLKWLSALGEDRKFQQARLRLLMMHHHLLRMPFDLAGRSPFEVGMRLENPGDVMNAAMDAGINILFHGHRHHGYVVQLPGYPMVVSSPSSTLGCKFTSDRYIWQMDLSKAVPHPDVFLLGQR